MNNLIRQLVRLGPQELARIYSELYISAGRKGQNAKTITTIR